MKALWRKYTERIDALALRERALLFGAAALLVVAVGNSLFIEPEFAAERRISKQTAERQAELAALQKQVQVLLGARQGDPEQKLRDRIAELRRRLSEVEVAVALEQKRFTSPEQIKAVLGEVLTRTRGLRLADLHTLPVGTIAESGARAPAAQPQRTQPAPPEPGGARLIYRHGVELAVTGGYLELHEYLRQLERLPTTMFWGKLDLNVTEHPQITLRLTVYTVSFDRAWMVV